MIFLHVLATKVRTKVSVPMGTPIPTKPSGWKLARAMSALRCVNAGLAAIRLCATSNAACCVTPLAGRMTVLLTLTGLFFENGLNLRQDLKGYR